jgi:small subunit ribosomal protein S6
LRTYETVFVLSPELAPDEVTAQAAFYKDNIVKNGGEIITCDEWGKRELAYPIDSFREAFYVLIQFKAEPAYISELERRYKYNELVLRHVVVMIDEKRFKLKPRKDPARRERRQDRKIEEGIAPEGIAQEGIAQEGGAPEGMLPDGILSEDAAQEGTQENIPQESSSESVLEQAVETPETSGTDIEPVAETAEAAEPTETDGNEPS